jgi:hypothetical protein
MSILNSTSAQIEKVRGKLEEYFENGTNLFNLIGKSGEAVTVSRYLYRIPIMRYVGGQFRKFGANGGTLGIGTGMKLTHLLGGYFYSVYGIRVNTETKDTTRTSEQSVLNVFAEQLARIMSEVQIYADISLHTDGTGILTNGASAIAAGPPATMTFAAATDFLGVHRLRQGMCVDVWNNAGSTKRAAATAAPIIIESIDTINKLVTFDQGVTALSTAGGGDIIAFRDMDIYGPAALTTMSATWPATGVAGGLGGDSFRHGIPYSNNVTTSNYYLSVLKSSLPELLANRVNGASGTITFNMIQRVIDGIIERRDESALSGLMGVAHMAQRTAVFNLGTAISNKQITGDSFGRNLDNHPSNNRYADRFEAGGIQFIISKRQASDRVDLFNPSKWGRAQVRDMYFFGEDSGYPKTFPGRGSDGTLSAYEEAFMIQAFDWVNHDPGSGGYIDSLALPALY